MNKEIDIQDCCLFEIAVSTKQLPGYVPMDSVIVDTAYFEPVGGKLQPPREE